MSDLDTVKFIHSILTRHMPVDRLCAYVDSEINQCTCGEYVGFGFEFHRAIEVAKALESSND